MSGKYTQVVTSQHLFSPKTSMHGQGKPDSGQRHRPNHSRTTSEAKLVSGFAQVSTPTCLLNPSSSPDNNKLVENKKSKVIEQSKASVGIHSGIQI